MNLDVSLDVFLVGGRLVEKNYETLDTFFKGGCMMMLIGAWWDLLLGRNDECEATLDAKVDAINVDVTLETLFNFEDGSLEESSEMLTGSAGSFSADVSLENKLFLNDEDGSWGAEGGVSFNSMLPSD